LRQADRNSCVSARLVIVGAEKMSTRLSEKFCERFGKRVMEGYGLTKQAPAAP